MAFVVTSIKVSHKAMLQKLPRVWVEWVGVRQIVHSNNRCAQQVENTAALTVFWQRPPRAFQHISDRGR